MSESQTTTRADWVRVLLIFGAGVVAAFQIGKPPPSLPFIRDDLNLSMFAAGWVISIFSLSSTTIGVLVGAISDRLGHRRLILFGLSVLATGSIAGGFSASSGILIASRFVEGLGFLAIVVSGPAMASRFAGVDHQRLALGIWSCFLPAGSACVMLLSPLVLGSVGWRGLWFANVFLLVIYAIILAAGTRGRSPKPVTTSAARSRMWPDIKSTIFHPGPLFLALCFFSYAVQYGAFMGFLPTLLIEDLGTTHSAAAVLAAVAVAMNAPGNLLGGVLLQRGARRMTLLITASVAMGLCAMGIYNDDLPVLARLVMATLFSGIGGMIPASLFAGTVTHAPDTSLVATTNGLMMQGANIGTTLGPPVLAAVVGAAGGWHAATWVIVPAAILCLLSSLGLGRLEGGQYRNR
jgi:MFS family permease